MDVEALKKLLAGRGPTVLGGLMAVAGVALGVGGYTGKVTLTPEQGGEIAGGLIFVGGLLVAAIRKALMATPPEAPKP